jgi:predicted nucleic acid-binding protein
MKYLLDTDTLIDFIQDRGQTRTRIVEMFTAGDVVAVCSITVSEFYSGVSEVKRKKWEHLVMSLPYWDISREAAMQAGIDRKIASADGRTLHIPDCLLAACAREQGATVLTSNTKDFDFMKDVRALSLRKDAA